jgi:hypothetical protein
MKTIRSDILAFKDKMLTLPLWPLLGLAELCFKGMHWSTQARLKTAVGNILCKNARYIHFKATGQHPTEEIMKATEASRHRKRRS